jgi:hypothetical protein
MNQTHQNPRHKYYALGLTILGIALMLFGFSYNIYHLDDALDGHTNPILQNASIIGVVLLIIAPIILRRYIWAGALVALAVIFEAWIYFAS